MPAQLTSFLKFLSLVVILNIIRYLVGGLLEQWLVLPGMFGAMEESAACFNTQFTTFDFATSYFYNFMMWLTISWLFVTMHPVLSGNFVIKSLKVYGLAYLFFVSLSAIYMNHYNHPKDFYLYSLWDGLLIFPLVAMANGLIYPFLFKKETKTAHP